MKSNEKTNILFPIEISNRELDFRLFLASYCAREDVRVFIGQTNAIYRLAKNIENGIYVGKNVFINLFPGGAHQLHRYQTLKKQGFTLVHLDEEGGVMKGDHERWKKWLRLRLDPTALGADDFLCVWGDWQRDFYLSQQPKCAQNTFVTGHPRFDLYKPHLRAFYADDAQKLQQRYGDFVLVNTNFAWANNRSGVTRPFSQKWNLDNSDAQKRLDHVAEWSNNSRILVSFVELVSQLSASRPDLQFVLRPHPSENIGFYNAVFGGVTNVQVVHEGSVGSWLLACRALIHDGCTTGLEAHIADCPVITYKAVEDERFELWLPNLFGAKCKTHEEVLEVLAQTKKREVAEIGTAQGSASTRGAESAAEKQAEELIANFGIDSFQALRDVVWKAVDAQENNSASRYAARRHGTFETMRNLSHALKLRNSSGDASRLDKFAPLSQTGLEKRMNAVQKLCGTSLSYRVISEELMSVETA